MLFLTLFRKAGILEAELAIVESVMVRELWAAIPMVQVLLAA
jgi:hypothetical protein